MKKEFACNGTVVSSADSEDEDSPGPAKPDFGKVLQLQGDQRVAVKNFLVSFGLVTEKEAKDSIVMYVSPRRARLTHTSHYPRYNHRTSKSRHVGRIVFADTRRSHGY